MTRTKRWDWEVLFLLQSGMGKPPPTLQDNATLALPLSLKTWESSWNSVGSAGAVQSKLLSLFFSGLCVICEVLATI